jgi:hypothetical protein
MKTDDVQVEEGLEFPVYLAKEVQSSMFTELKLSCKLWCERAATSRMKPGYYAACVTGWRAD